MSLRIFEHLFRHKLLLILPVIFGGILGVLWMVSSYSTYYQSRATVWVDKPADFSGAGVSITDFNPYISPAANQANSMRELLATKSFLGSVIARIDGTTDIPASRYVDIGSRVQISPSGNHLVYVLAKSQSPEEAANITQAVIDEYGAVFTRQVKETAARAADFYKGQVDLAKVDYDKSTADLQNLLRLRPSLAVQANPNRPLTGAATVTDPEYGKLLIAHDTAESNYDKMVEKYANSQIAATSANSVTAFYSVVDRAEVPTLKVVPSKKKLLVQPVSGVVVGLMFACGLYLLVWRLDRKARYASDLSFVGADVVVLSLPILRARRRRWPVNFVRIAAALQAGIRNLAVKPEADASQLGS